MTYVSTSTCDIWNQFTDPTMFRKTTQKQKHVFTLFNLTYVNSQSHARN